MAAFPGLRLLGPVLMSRPVLVYQAQLLPPKQPFNTANLALFALILLLLLCSSILDSSARLGSSAPAR